MAHNHSHPVPSSSLPRLSSPSRTGDDDPAAASDAPEDSMDAAYWKRRYQTLKEEANTSKKSRKKSGSTSTLIQIGRGIRKAIFICGDIKDLVVESDKYREFVADPEALLDDFDGLDDEQVKDLKRDWERSDKCIQILHRLLPNIQKVIQESSPDDLIDYFTQLQLGANNARSDDLNRMRSSVADWLNQMLPTSEHAIDREKRDNRGLNHDLTGRLLCPVEFNWDDLEIRAKIRAGHEDFDWLSSFHARAFYAQLKGDPKKLEEGFLKSALLVKVYKAIFTSPSSAAEVADDDQSDCENEPPSKTIKLSQSRKKATQRNVASKLNLNDKVTPRTIAYAAVQLHFNLQTADRWHEVYGGFDYRGLHNYIVDYFEDIQEPAAKKRAQKLLDWWSMKVFPAASAHRQSNTSTSRKAMRDQRAAHAPAASSATTPA